MPAQDQNLYGQLPPRKKQKKEVVLPGSLDFTSQLSSILATGSGTKSSSSSSATATSARPRPSKSKTSDLFGNVKIKRSKAPKDDSNDATTPTTTSKKLALKETHGTEAEKAERDFARRKMESKARLYEAMKRGDYIGKEIGLVDFDRKWAEKQDKDNKDAAHSSGSDYSDSDNDDNKQPEKEQLVEYTDEFGRIRLVTAVQKARMESRVARGQASALELEIMSGRPIAQPENLIFGDAVQTEAFAGGDAMEELARKRDRSATPPPDTHYDASREIRTKGVGFFAFSRDEAQRAEEMRSLDAERERTEKVRRERDELMARRRREMEERRREIGERKAKKMADSFLQGLDFMPGVGSGGGESGKGKAESESKGTGTRGEGGDTGDIKDSRVGG